MHISRRSLVAASVAAAALPAQQQTDQASRICLFTDHLAGFSYTEVARMLKELGVSGPDLTVRQGGLVAPERVATELPKALEAFKKQSLSIPMMTTTITTAQDPLNRKVLETASKLGIRYYKLGYFAYKDMARWRETIDATSGALRELAKLGTALDIRAGMHNHSGESVGCTMWDSWDAMRDVDPKRVGFQYDPSHATIEGGLNGWNLNLRRVTPRIFMMAIKDYLWEKTPKGWYRRWVPLGEGMVNWTAFFPLLRATSFPGPISLHIEYDPGGKTLNERYDRSLAAAAKDLQFLKRNLKAVA